MKRPVARITGTGGYLPERRMDNHELSKRVETSDAWIRERTGIIERRIAAPGEMTSDLALQASRRALEMAGLTVNDLDMILVGTISPDLLFPSVATLLLRKLGGTRFIPAFDLQAACTGFLYGLSVGESFIASGQCRRVLVCGAETFSRVVDWRDRSTCVLFGDGAGAVVLEAVEGTEDGRGLLSTHIHADGVSADLLKASGGVSAGPPSDRGPEMDGIGYVLMQGNEVYKQAVTVMGRLVDETLAANGLEKSQVDWLVPHQANIRIIQGIAKRLGMGMDRVVVTVERHGNTSAASVPLALDEAVRDGRIQPGQLVLMEAFGAGFTWGSALMRW
ncbi:MAG: ketoacyl-ACP synthase III [Magnetococcales bacterium]|nr:ketoacyl-ACP synthase III [Magnetococcales bacterium]